MPTLDEKYEAKRYCEFLERVCNLRSLSYSSKRWIVEQFNKVTSLDELARLCHYISARLKAVAANPDYFTV